MTLSPVLTGLTTYPFVRLAEAKRAVAATGVDVIDLEHRRAARGDARLHPRGARRGGRARSRPTPSTEGLPELRAAIAGWAERRFGAALDPGTQVLPTMGSKEAVFSLAQVLGGGRVAIPAPAYPVYERGALFAGKDVLELPLAEARGFLPDLDAVDAATWRDVAVLWLNYPNNPTAATAPLALYEQRRGAGARARLRRRLRRGVLGDLLRRAARLGAPARRPRPACSCSTRSPSARRCRATGRASSPATPR